MPRYSKETLALALALMLGAGGQRVFQPLGMPAEASAPAPVVIDPYLAERLASVPERLAGLEAEVRGLNQRLDRLEELPTRRVHNARRSQ